MNGGSKIIEIAYLKEEGKAKTLPEEVQKVIEEILDILDTEYGEYFSLTDVNFPGNL